MKGFEYTWAYTVDQQLNSLKVPPVEMGKSRVHPVLIDMPEHAKFCDTCRRNQERGHRRKWRPFRMRFWIVVVGMVILLSAVKVHYPITFMLVPLYGWGYYLWQTCKLETERDKLQDEPESQSVPQGRSPYVYQGPLRIGDLERDAVLSELTDHYSAGRLKLDEYEGRMTEVLNAVTGEDLDKCLRELPELSHTPNPQAVRWVARTGRRIP